MFKRNILLLVLIGVLGIVLAACGQGESKDSESALVVMGDVITSATVESAPCVVTSRFEQGQRLVFRASVEDVFEGELIEDAKVKVVLGTGEEFDMELGPHGEEQTLLYTVGYDIEEDAATGTLDYKYVAEVDGKEYEYEPFDVSLSRLTIIESADASVDSE